MRAMILAAGLGTRLRPLTLTTPKPLIKVNQVPLIEYQIRNLARAGIRELVINHAWLGEQIEAALGDGARFGVSIHYSPEAQPLETAGGIRQALQWLDQGEDRPFIVVNGDVYTELEYASADLSLSESDQAKLWLVANPDWHRDGDFAIAENGRVLAAGEQRLTFAGISLMRPSLLRSISAGEVAPLAPLLRQAVESDQVGFARLDAYWNDVGTLERLQAVEQHIKNGLN